MRIPVGAFRALFLATLLAAPSQVAAVESPCARYGRADAVVVGLARAPVSRTISLGADLPPMRIDVTPVTVERVFVGKLQGTAYLMLPGKGLALNAGERYLIYANYDVQGSEVLTPQFPWHTLEEATEDLAFLDGTAGAAGATIRGRLLAGDPGDSTQPRTPLPGTTIRVSAESFDVAVVTGEDGSFGLSNVPEGPISIRPDLPDHLGELRRQITARTGGCAEVEFVASFNGRVRGRVVRDDRGPTNWLVDLVPTDPRRSKLSTHRLRIRASRSGEFEFANLAPGEYLLAVNLLGPPNPAFPFATTYYPGTTEASRAIPIVVGQGTVHDGYVLPLTDTRRSGKLIVKVDARIAGQMTVCVRDLVDGQPRGGGNYRASPSAPAVVQVVERASYRIWAHVEGPREHAESSVVDVVAGIGTQEVLLSADPSSRTHAPDSPCDTGALQRR